MSDGVTISLDHEQIRAIQQADASSDHRLAFLVFLATLAGNLIALIASLADATNLVVPVLDLVAPMPRLTIAGSNTILGPELRLTSDWIENYQSLNMEALDLPLVGEVERTTKFAVDPVGTLRGIELAAAGQLRLLAASEALGDEDTRRLAADGVSVLCAAPIGYDVVAFVTDITNNLPRPLTRTELVGILAGTTRNWSDVGGKAGPIRVFARQGSGTTDLVLRAYLGDHRVPDHVIPCASQAECLNLTLSTPGSLYWVSSAWLRTQPSNYLQPILIEQGPGMGADPLSPQFLPSQYPSELVRPLYMYVLSSTEMDPRSAQLGRRFLEYVRGVQGQRILEAHHFYTHFDPPGGVLLQLPPGFGPRPDGPPVICQGATSQVP